MAEDEQVPKLPRGRGLKLSTSGMIRVALTAAMLVAIIAFAGPCGKAVSSFVMQFDNGAGQGSAMPKPDTAKQPTHYEVLRPGMSDEETKAAIERARKAADPASGVRPPASGSGTGTGSPATGAGSSSAPTGSNR